MTRLGREPEVASGAPGRRPLFRWPSAVTASAVAGLLLVSGSSVTGCTSSRQAARDDAVAAVRAEAISVQEDVSAAARGASGAAQVEAVRSAVVGTPLEVDDDGDGVVVTGALSEHRFAGGGLTYEAFTARLCLVYSVAPGSGVTDVADAPCPPDVDTEVPADATVTLD